MVRKILIYRFVARVLVILVSAMRNAAVLAAMAFAELKQMLALVLRTLIGVRWRRRRNSKKSQWTMNPNSKRY